jgi:hypothetical protein
VLSHFRYPFILGETKIAGRQRDSIPTAAIFWDSVPEFRQDAKEREVCRPEM